MPNNIVKSFAQKSGKSVEEVEKLWDKIKKGVAEGGTSESDPDFYKFVTGRLKKALGLSEETFMKFTKYLIEDEDEKKDSAEATLKKKLKGAENEDTSKGKKKKDVKKPSDDKEEVEENCSGRKKKMKEALTLEAEDAKGKSGKEVADDDEGTPQEHLALIIDWIEEDDQGDESGEEGELEFGLIILRDIAEHLTDDVADAVSDALIEYYGLEHYADDNEDDDEEPEEEALAELDDYVVRMQRDDVNESEELDERLDAKKKRKLFLRKKRKAQLGARANTAAFKRNYYFDKEKRKFVKRHKPMSMSNLRKKKRILKKVVKRRSTQIRMQRTKKRLAHVKNPYATSSPAQKPGGSK